MKNGKKEGRGVLVTENLAGEVTETYAGYWKNDMKHGQGRTVFVDGSVEFGKYDKDIATEVITGKIDI